MSFCCDEPSLFVPASPAATSYHRERQINALTDGRGIVSAEFRNVFIVFYRRLRVPRQRICVCLFRPIEVEICRNFW